VIANGADRAPLDKARPAGALPDGEAEPAKVEAAPTLPPAAGDPPVTPATVPATLPSPARVAPPTTEPAAGAAGEEPFDDCRVGAAEETAFVTVETAPETPLVTVVTRAGGGPGFGAGTVGVGTGVGGGDGGGGGLIGVVTVGTVIGTVGTGTGVVTDGTGTVDVGSGGVGSPSASATPAAAPPTSRPTAVITAADLTYVERPTAENGCASARTGHNPRMSAVKQDYYELLGIPRDADAGAIRRAFRAAVRSFDPADDASPEGEARLRELQEAYGVLSRPGPRLLYDRHGYRARSGSVLDRPLWESREPAHGEDVNEELVLRWFETDEGTERLVKFEAAQTCPECDGSGSAGEPDPNCPACGGSGRYAHRSNDARPREVEPCPVCSPDACEHCGGSGRVDVLRRLRVRVPPGIETGEQLRVAGEGNAAPRGGTPGNLLLDVTVVPEPRESRVVRYVALLLFLIAVAVLYVYLR
jgi:curved DNA-binding protein CbpA